MKRLLPLVLVVALSGCAALRPITCSIKSAADYLCCLTAQEQPPEALDGMSASAWCAIEKNLEPFVATAREAKERAARRAGFVK